MSAPGGAAAPPGAAASPPRPWPAGPPSTAGGPPPRPGPPPTPWSSTPPPVPSTRWWTSSSSSSKPPEPPARDDRRIRPQGARRPGQPCPGRPRGTGQPRPGRPGDASVTEAAPAATSATDPERGYKIAAAVVKPLMRSWFRIRLEGHEHVPDEGPVILASNHRSNMDPVLLASAVERPVAFMAKAELFVGPLGWVMRWIGQFPVRRGGI